MTYNLNKSDRIGVMRIVTIYAVFSSLWIYLSDTVLGLFVRDVGTITRLFEIKGVLFVVLTAFLLYRLIIQYARVLREAEDEMRKAKEAAESANLAKSQFLANMSHELRTPMSGVLGMLEIAIGGNLDAQERGFIQTAHRSASALVRILNDILEMTRIEEGMLSIEEKSFPLRECINGVADIFIAEARRKKIDLVLSMADDVPETVVGDQLRLEQVLTNLVANAIKFTDQGMVELKVEVSSPAPTENRDITFTVTDTGIGIPCDKLTLLFLPFSQVNGSHSRKYGGTGLGLAISKEIVERMGGTIIFDCNEGTGCSFKFTMPFGEVGGGPSPATTEADTKENKSADTCR